MNRVEFAKRTAGAISSALTAKTDALAANAADAQRLEALAAEISEAEHRLDPENLAQIQLLAAKRDQHARLSTKFTADSEKRLADADAALGIALDADKLAAFFRAEHEALLENIADTLRPFVAARARALQVAQQTDAARAVSRLNYICVNNPFRQPLPADEILAAVEGVATGKPTWIQP